MNKKYLAGLAGVCVILIIPLVIAHLYYGNQIQFIGYKFTEEYWKFLGTLVSVGFGFLLINVFWGRKELNDKINQTRGLLLNYLLKIYKIASTINSLLDLVYDCNILEKSKDRDREIMRLGNKISLLGQSLEILTIEPQVFSNNLLRKIYVDFIWGDLIDNIDKLSKINDLRVNYNEFRIVIDAILLVCKEGVSTLSNINLGGENE